ERVLPQLLPLVASALQEPLELAVGHLMAVDQEIAQPYVGPSEPKEVVVEMASAHPHHFSGNCVIPIELDHGIERHSNQLQSSIARRLDPEPVGGADRPSCGPGQHCLLQGSSP